MEAFSATVRNHNPFGVHVILYTYTIYHTIYGIPYHTTPYHAIPYHTIPYHTIPYHTIPYHIPLYHYTIIPLYHTIMPLIQISYSDETKCKQARSYHGASMQHTATRGSTRQCNMQAMRVSYGCLGGSSTAKWSSATSLIAARVERCTHEFSWSTSLAFLLHFSFSNPKRITVS